MTDLEKIALDSLKEQIRKMGEEKNTILGCYEPLPYGFKQMLLNSACERLHKAWEECNKIIKILKQ
jgi:hypothetical protein